MAKVIKIRLFHLLEIVSGRGGMQQQRRRRRNTKTRCGGGGGGGGGGDGSDNESAEWFDEGDYEANSNLEDMPSRINALEDA